MEFNKETFEKALKANKIVRYQKHFESVVKSYLKIENQALRTHDVVWRSEQLKALEKLKDFAYEVCPLHRENDLEEIVGNL